MGRYAKRPCLSEAKIIFYEKENNLISFTYHDKLTQEDQIMDMTINEFIGALIRHIPEKGFNMIRYYGMYANVLKWKILKILAKRLIYLYGRVYLTFEPQIRTWRDRIKDMTNIDPLFCQKCHKYLTLVQINYRIRDETWKTALVH